MKARTLILTLTLTLLTALAAQAGTGSGWTEDFEAARAQAKAEGKVLLVDFTGSDWCGWCQRLDKEVFSQPAFADFAAKRLVLVKVDFPKAVAQSEAVKKQNEELLRKYGVEGFPTILLMKPDGTVVERTGYRRGGAEAYVAYLESLLKDAASQAKS